MPIDYSKVANPCYVVDEESLRRNLSVIKHIKENAGIEIILAFKGFAMWGVFPIVKQYINYAAASSVNEARLAFEQMKTPAHTYSPAFADEEFDEILKYSSHITFNSLSQFNRLINSVLKSGKNISMGLRVNPGYSEATAELYDPSAPGTRLGVAVENLPNELPDEIEGLHFHTLCEASSYALEKTLQQFENRFGKYLHKIKWINMGGGHLLSRKNYDTAHLIELLQNFRKKYPLKIILEPGAAFAWQTGVLTSKIVDIVEDNNIKTAILNISFTAHLPDCLEMPYKPDIIGASEPKTGKPVYRMGGNSCLAGDFVGNWSFDKELKVGDLIVFDDMIHYTMVKTNMFNGVSHPSIGIWNQKDGFRLIRKFGYEDYKSRLS